LRANGHGRGHRPAHVRALGNRARLDEGSEDPPAQHSASRLSRFAPWRPPPPCRRRTRPHPPRRMNPSRRLGLHLFLRACEVIVFGMAIPPRTGLAMEFSVGLMLILLGFLNLSGAMKWLSEKFSPSHPAQIGTHAHLHQHDHHLHFHWHSHSAGQEHHGDSLTAPNWLRKPFARLGLFHALRPLLVGIIHGLAGSAAVALLVLSTIRQPKWALLYLLI